MREETKAELIDNVLKRWGCWVRPQLDREQIGRVYAISLGLGALFNEDAAAERKWMRSVRPDLANRSPLTAVLAGDIIPVQEIVLKERCLW